MLPPSAVGSMGRTIVMDFGPLRADGVVPSDPGVVSPGLTAQPILTSARNRARSLMNPRRIPTSRTSARRDAGSLGRLRMILDVGFDVLFHVVRLVARHGGLRRRPTDEMEVVGIGVNDGVAATIDLFPHPPGLAAVHAGARRECARVGEWALRPAVVVPLGQLTPELLVRGHELLVADDERGVGSEDPRRT